MISNLVAQFLGVCGLITLVASFQINDRKKIIHLLALGSLFYAAHFFMLGALTAAYLNIISVFRSYIFSLRNDKKWANHSSWIYIFTILFAVMTYFTWAGLISLLPAFGMIMGNFAQWTKNPKYVRWLSAPCPPVWFIHNITVGSIPAMITDGIVFGSIIVGIVRFDILKQKENKK